MANNEVIVIGTIHSQHKSSKDYSLEIFRKMIEALKPDVVLAEVPPDRFEIATAQYNKHHKISEPRVVQYPEFAEVIFPLKDSLHFDLIPVSAWTEKMATDREERLEEIKYDTNRSEDWQKYIAAREKTTALFDAFMPEFDFLKIHTPRFDEIMEIELKVFNELFNEDLGDGGWDNINNAHYALIHKALENITDKKVLIIFGAGHKGWLIRKLKERDGITLLSLQNALLETNNLK
jgi:hypothetical protein